MADRRNAQSMKVLVDKGYKGVRSHGRRSVTPHKKLAGGVLTAALNIENIDIAVCRGIVKNYFSRRVML